MKKEAIFVVYSDIHHHIYNNFNEGDRRIKESIRVEKEIYRVAKQLDVPKLFVGDILHNEKSVSNKLLEYILPHYAKLLGSTNNPTIAITGNHDQSEQNTPEHRSPSYINTFSKIFPGLICLDFEHIIENGCKIHGIPYLTHDIGMYESIKKCKKEIDKDYKNILMLHTTLPGSIDTDGRPMENLTLGNRTLKLLKKFDLVIVGHIHRPMMLGKNILQVGATNQQRKTDKDSDLGYWVIYQDLSVKFFPIKSAKFVELDWGEDKPDNKNYYYNKLKEVTPSEFKTQIEGNFHKVDDRGALAKNYIKEKGIKDKQKKEALHKALKDVE